MGSGASKTSKDDKVVQIDVSPSKESISLDALAPPSTAPSPKSMIEVFVNGKTVHVSNTANLVEACHFAGVYVPTLCYHPRLQPIGLEVV